MSYIELLNQGLTGFTGSEFATPQSRFQLWSRLILKMLTHDQPTESELKQFAAQAAEDICKSQRCPGQPGQWESLI